jgi:hypothetical protein
VDFDFYIWRIQLVLSLLFAMHIARLARLKGRHPFAAALLLLTLANGWPIIFEAVGRLIAWRFNLRDPAQTTFVKIVGYGGIMFGVATSYAIVGCLRPLRTRIMS